MKYRAFRVLLAICNALPLSAIHWLGRVVGRLAWLKNGEYRRVAQTNIRLCFPELDASRQIELAKQALAEAGKVTLEGGKMWRGRPDDVLALIESVEGEHLIGTAQREGRGVILAIPHFGCWELIGLYCARRYAMTTMYVARVGPEFDRFARAARQRTGATLVPADGIGLRATVRALRNEELVALMPDQIPAADGVFADFFGRSCYTMTLLPKLARSTNAVVLIAGAERLPNSRGYRLIFRPSSQDMARLDVDAAAQTMNDDIAALVREAPAQYWWVYKRFRVRPEGAQPVY